MTKNCNGIKAEFYYYYYRFTATHLFTYLTVFSLSLLDHWLNSFDANKWQNSQAKIVRNSFWFGFFPLSIFGFISIFRAQIMWKCSNTVSFFSSFFPFSFISPFSDTVFFQNSLANNYSHNWIFSIIIFFSCVPQKDDSPSPLPMRMGLRSTNSRTNANITRALVR